MAGKAPAKNWFQHIQGETPVLIVAGHATPHLRNRRIKIADTGTASLGILLQKTTRASLLITTAQAPQDPNWTDKTPFKEKLGSILQEHPPEFVLDLHTARIERPFAIDIGTMHGESLLGRDDLKVSLIEALQDVGTVTENIFSASKRRTVTKFAAARNVPAMQLEINGSLMVTPTHIPEEFEKLAASLGNFICASKERCISLS